MAEYAKTAPMTIGNKVLLTAFIPLAGLIMGCIELAKGRGPQGALLLMIAVVATVAWAIALAALAAL